jgi:electron transfer flavoprotein alpha subunit
MATVRPGVFPKPERRISQPITERIEIDLEKARSPFVLLSSEEQISEFGDIENAALVLAGGAGMGSKDAFSALMELAKPFGGAVGGTREAVDRGWLPKSQQIGQTGSSISPDVYIACGISGAIHHLVGIHRAKTIISINTDPHAPIMRLSDIAIVADVRETIPKLMAICAELKIGMTQKGGGHDNR